jgi:hypothetical protein
MGIKAPEWRHLNAYLWFGLDDFEDDTLIIEAACDQLMSRLQQVINPSNYNVKKEEKDVARALWFASNDRKKILLNSTLKAEYDADERIKQKYFGYVRSVATRPQTPPATAPTEPPASDIQIITQREKTVAPPISPIVTKRTSAALVKRQKAKYRRRQLFIRLVYIMCGALLGLALGYLFSPRA